MPKENEDTSNTGSSTGGSGSTNARLQEELRIAQENNALLENLLLTGPQFVAPAAASREAPTKPEELDSADKIVNAAVERVKKEIVVPREEAEAKAAQAQAKADATAALNSMKNDPKTKDVVLYTEEMKNLALTTKGLNMGELYDLAKAGHIRAAGKAKTFQKEERANPATLEVGRIRPAEGLERPFGEVKVKTRAEAEARFEKTFDSAIEAGLEAAGLKLGE